MKLRALVLLLVLANLGFFAWTRGALDNVVGLPAHGDREPARMARQFQPQSVRILSPGEATSAWAASAPETGATCLEAGPFTAAEAGVAESIVAQAALPPGSWARRTVEAPGGGVTLRVERADPALAAQLAALVGDIKGQPLGKAFGPCAR